LGVSAYKSVNSRPKDDGSTVEGPDIRNLKSIVTGILTGRKTKGAIYVFATGNGRQKDNCNYDGYSNSVFTVSIGAINSHDETPSYMEDCTAQLFVTYSSGDDRLTDPRIVISECLCNLGHYRLQRYSMYR
jgi:kexin